MREWEIRKSAPPKDRLERPPPHSAGMASEGLPSPSSAVSEGASTRRYPECCASLCGSTINLCWGHAMYVLFRRAHQPHAFFTYNHLLLRRQMSGRIWSGRLSGTSPRTIPGTRLSLRVRPALRRGELGLGQGWPRMTERAVTWELSGPGIMGVAVYHTVPHSISLFAALRTSPSLSVITMNR